MKKPGREVIVVSDSDALAIAAARHVADWMAESPRPAVCLSGGSSPARLYELLRAPPFKDRVAWRAAHWFMGDERLVPFDDPRSNIGQARKIFLDRCAPPDHVHLVPTDQPGAEAAALAYERELRAFYGSNRLDPARPLFDVVLMGLGPDGHTASLFPEAPHDDRDRWVIGVAEPNVEPFVPRVTLTYATLASCRHMLFLVSGSAKREIFARIQRGDDLPASRAHSSALTTWLVDRAAAGDAA